MPFADPYLRKISLEDNILSPEPGPDLHIIVAIPVQNEPDLGATLNTLGRCNRTSCEVEIILSVNSAETSDPGVHTQNLLSIRETEKFLSEQRPWFRIVILHRTGIPERDSGAGYARKIAMDHALARFNAACNPDGIIVSLDADTVVEPDYLIEIEKHFSLHPDSPGCSVYFEHPLEGGDLPPMAYMGIASYELHMRYYVEGLRYAGHPHAFHTVGSAFAVRSATYAAQGGMNKRGAGEDFYFLQKIIPLGGFTELNSTCLHPSPRPSDRVAFGTGPVIRDFISGKKSAMESYDPRCFSDLKNFLSRVQEMYTGDQAWMQVLFERLPPSIREDTGYEFFEKTSEIFRNSSSAESFVKRFFRWFNMFRTLKYINRSHRSQYHRLPVEEAVKGFLRMRGGGLKASEGIIKAVSDASTADLLCAFRQKQRTGTWDFSAGTLDLSPPR